MNVYSYMVVKNEADRYLKESVAHLKSLVDGLFVLDDYSQDSTLEILRELHVPHMSNTGQPFMVNESAARQTAWLYMERMFNPRVGDWIVTLDADEFLRTRIPLKQIFADTDHDALWCHIHEMWSPEEIRIDGAWGTIRGLRMVAWKPLSLFKPVVMGGGSIPPTQRAGHTDQADIVHRGYVRLEDRREKFERYSQRPGRHVNNHINSILTTPMLVPLPQMV